MSGGWPPVVAVVAVCVATLAVGAVGLRLARTTSDFYVASRVVSPTWNASAIGGEYLSAASFLGVAGLVLAFGVDMLWFPIGYTAGYLVLLVLVAAPLRRSGAYTLPDFAEIRMRSAAVRRVAATLVVAIGWLYLLPQFVGAGLALRSTTGAPGWVGTAVVAGVVVLGVLGGGMRSITFAQAFQYWLKLTAIAFPVLFMLFAWNADGRPDPTTEGRPATRAALDARLAEPVRLRVVEPVTLVVRGRVDGRAVDGVVRLVPDGTRPRTVEIAAGTVVTVPAGQSVPHADGLPVLDGAAWSSMAGEASDAGSPDARSDTGAEERDHRLYRTYSLALALLLGTMGLPHVVLRFYTNPDGRAARRTAAAVVGLLGMFYLFPPVYAALGRVYAADLLLTGRTDTVVLALPERMIPGPWGQALSALLTAGAFAAFLSTASGLTVSVAGVLSQDLLRGRPRASVRGFRMATLAAVAVPAALATPAGRIGLADTVGLAFAVAASTFGPMLVLGIWWRGLTVAGALAGLVVGGLSAATAVVVTMLDAGRPGLLGALLAQPAAWTVPLAFLVMVVVSRCTPGSVPPGTRRIMVLLHAPEGLDLDRGSLGRPGTTDIPEVSGVPGVPEVADVTGPPDPGDTCPGRSSWETDRSARTGGPSDD